MRPSALPRGAVLSHRFLWAALALAAGFALRGLALALDNDRLSALLAGGVLLAAYTLCRRPLHLAVLSPALLYLGVFALFHLGLAVPWALDLYGGPLPWWFLTNRLTPALALVLLATAAYLAGALAAARPTGQPAAHLGYSNSFSYVAGIAICITGAAMFLLGIESLGGARFLDAGYNETYRLTGQFDPRLFGTSFTVFPIGLYLVAAACPRRRAPVAGAVALVWAAGIFYLGFRGYALIPGLVVLAVLRERGCGLPRPAALALAALVLVSIPAARAVRDQGVRQRSLGAATARLQPLDGVVEMGGSLRPLVHTLVYTESEPRRWGLTYWRSLATIWPNLSRRWTPGRYLRLDELPPNHWLTSQAEPAMYRNYGGLGFSAVAEPYMNFGVAGVVVYFAALGAVLGRAAGFAAGRPLPLALWAMVLGPLLWTTRNSFEIFFRPAAWGLATALAVHWLAGALPGRRPAARPALGISYARPHCQ
jgi:hypothetical protein